MIWGIGSMRTDCSHTACFVLPVHFLAVQEQESISCGKTSDYMDLILNY